MPSETTGRVPLGAATGWQPDAGATIVSDLFQRLRTVQANAFQAQVEAAQHATARALEAAGSLLRAKDPADVLAAQSALALALAEFAAAPARASLDALPRMQECCLAALRPPT